MEEGQITNQLLRIHPQAHYSYYRPIEPCLMEEEEALSDRSTPTSKDYPMFTLPGKTRPIVVTVQVQVVDLPMELDTRASLSLISETTLSSTILHLILHSLHIQDILMSKSTTSLNLHHSHY